MRSVLIPSSCDSCVFLFPARAACKIKKSSGVTKFKVRCSRYLYTLVVNDSQKANKLQQALPPGTPAIVSCRIILLHHVGIRHDRFPLLLSCLFQVVGNYVFVVARFRLLQA